MIEGSATAHTTSIAIPDEDDFILVAALTLDSCDVGTAQFRNSVTTLPRL
jgi:hypothetical protein